MSTEVQMRPKVWWNVALFGILPPRVVADSYPGIPGHTLACSPIKCCF